MLKLLKNGVLEVENLLETFVKKINLKNKYYGV